MDFQGAANKLQHECALFQRINSHPVPSRVNRVGIEDNEIEMILQVQFRSEVWLRRLVENPDCALYRDQMALICPRCLSPLDARLGYDFAANQHAHDWNGDATLQTVWDQIITYEQFQLKVMRQRAGRTKRQCLVFEFRGLLNLLLSTEKPNDLRPVDVLDSTYFPSPAKLGFATRQLAQPLHICHLVERRKALAIVIFMLEDTVDAFGFDSGSTPLHRLRELMYRDTYDQLERHILNIARLALPI